MNIELKNINVNSRLSEETNCYTAVLYLDGKPIADVSNRGCGGPDEIHWRQGKREALQQVETYCKTLPPVKSEYFPDSLPMDLELWCGDRVAEHLAKRHMQSVLKKAVVFRKPGDTGLSTMKAKGFSIERIIDHTLKKYPGSIILNLLPTDQALKEWNTE